MTRGKGASGFPWARPLLTSKRRPGLCVFASASAVTPSGSLLRMLLGLYGTGSLREGRTKGRGGKRARRKRPGRKGGGLLGGERERKREKTNRSTKQQ